MAGLQLGKRIFFELSQSQLRRHAIPLIQAIRNMFFLRACVPASVSIVTYRQPQGLLNTGFSITKT